MDAVLRIVARAPITHHAANGEVTHAPMVVAQVNGIEARLVLDTGADVHLVTSDFADRLGLDTTPAEDGTDHGGASVKSRELPDVMLSLGGATFELSGVVVIPAFEAFTRMGIDGILSPQNISGTAMAVLDMAPNELLLLDGSDEAIARWLKERSPDLRMLELERDQSEGMVVVKSAIAPNAAVPTLLDSGGKRTEFARAAVPRLAGSPAGKSERLGGGVSGGDFSGADAGAQTLVIGGQRLSVPSLAVREEMHGPPGLVGMDVLRGTILACAADRDRPVFLLVRAAFAASQTSGPRDSSRRQ